MPTRSSVLELRKNSNQVLATIIWGNVTTNVLLTLLSDSVLAGVAGVLVLGLRYHAARRDHSAGLFLAKRAADDGAFLPFLDFYRFVLYPLAKPTALLLDGGSAMKASTISASAMSAR